MDFRPALNVALSYNFFMVGRSEIRRKPISQLFSSRASLPSNVSVHISRNLRCYSCARKRATLKFPTLTLTGFHFVWAQGHSHCFQFLSSLHFSFPYFLLFFFPSGVDLHDTSPSSLTQEHGCLCHPLSLAGVRLRHEQVLTQNLTVASKGGTMGVTHSGGG